MIKDKDLLPTHWCLLDFWLPGMSCLPNMHRAGQRIVILQNNRWGWNSPTEEEKYVREGEHTRLGGAWKHTHITLYVAYPINKTGITISPALPSVVYIKNIKPSTTSPSKEVKNGTLSTSWLSPPCAHPIPRAGKCCHRHNLVLSITVVAKNTKFGT